MKQHFEPDGIYTVDNIYTVSGQDLNITRQWLQDYSDRLDAALGVMGITARVNGGRRRRNSVDFTLDQPLTVAEINYAAKTLNSALNKHGQIATVTISVIKIREMTDAEKRQQYLCSMSWQLASA